MKANNITEKISKALSNLTVLTNTSNNWEAKFVVDDQIYIFDASLDKYWDVIFANYTDNYPQWGRVETKNSLKVFKVIEQVLSLFIKSKNPKVISFSSDSEDSSRVKLYRSFGKRLDRKFGYKLVKEVKSTLFNKITFYYAKSK